MFKYGWSLFLLCGLLSACEQEALQEQQSATPAASGLEQAALEAGVVADIDALPPVGLYRKRHEAGRDSLCIVEGGDGKQHFALEAVFGQNARCRGKGTLRSSGDKLVMNFGRSACIIVAGYGGDTITMPGALDVECAKLCSERASLEGVNFPRVSRDQGVARTARRSDGKTLCP